MLPCVNLTKKYCCGTMVILRHFNIYHGTKIHVQNLYDTPNVQKSLNMVIKMSITKKVSCF